MKKTLAAVLSTLALVLCLSVPAFAVADASSALPDGNYDVDYTLVGDGTTKLVEPALLTVKDGKNYVRLAFNDPEVDKLVKNGTEYLPVDFTKSHNIQGKLPVFELPLSAFDKDISFQVHTRGVNLEVDRYTVNVKPYDPNFDATAIKESVAEGIRGAQPVKFYGWSIGKSSSIWGPFVFLAVEAVAIYGWIALQKKKDE